MFSFGLQTHITSNRHVIHYRSEFCKLRKLAGEAAAVRHNNVPTFNKFHRFLADIQISMAADFL